MPCWALHRLSAYRAGADALGRVQVWCALSLISSIRHRTVLIRLLHLKGTTRTALRAAELAESLKLQVLQPTTAQLKVCQEMEEKLKTLEL